MNPFIWLILTVLEIYIWVVIATVIMSWLLAFNVVNMQNNLVRQIAYVLAQLTEPLLEPIRRYMPQLGGLDLSPLVLLLGLYFLQRLIIYYVPATVI
jgi:YggT family protein